MIIDEDRGIGLVAGALCSISRPSRSRFEREVVNRLWKDGLVAECIAIYGDESFCADFHITGPGPEAAAYRFSL